MTTKPKGRSKKGKIEEDLQEDKKARDKKRKRRAEFKKRESLVPREQRKAIAAQLLAEGKLTSQEIADCVGISRRYFVTWKKEPEFSQMVEAATNVYAKQFMTQGLAQKDRRLLVLNTVHNKVMEAVRERGEAEGMADIPGGATGMVARTLKGIGKGDDFQVVEEYKIDTPVVKSILEIHSAVREELGENRQRLELTGPDGKPLEPPKLQVSFLAVAARPPATIAPPPVYHAPSEQAPPRHNASPDVVDKPQLSVGWLESVNHGG